MVRGGHYRPSRHPRAKVTAASGSGLRYRCTAVRRSRESAYRGAVLGRKKVREDPVRVFTVGDLAEAVDRAKAVGLGDAARVYVQSRRGLRRRRYIAELRLSDVDWLNPADDFRVLLLVTRREWRLRS
jgi:hypothetical protein